MHNPWYMDDVVDEGIIVSSRIRLARNIEPYYFTVKLTPEKAQEMMKETTKALLGDRSVYGKNFSFQELTDTHKEALLELMERHIISPEMVRKKSPRGILTLEDESISIMIGEEDHIRIQTISPGNSLKDSFLLANQLDDFLGETITYSFDKKLGYLTACPTNTGTGLRASYMLHLPAMDEMPYAWAQTLPILEKMGLTIRGIHGEGTMAHGHLYQLSNQVTLGVTEAEILSILEQMTMQLMNQENAFRKQWFLHHKIDALDKIYRSYGNLIYAKKMSVSEALACLSDIRLGYQIGLLQEKRPQKTIYELMMHIQPALLKMQKIKEGVEVSDDEFRAQYLKRHFS